MTGRILVLGPESGWHADRLRDAARSRGMVIHWARYETLKTRIGSDGTHQVFCLLTATEQVCETEHWVDLSLYDHVLARTMPVGSLEQITLRLNVLHGLVDAGRSVVNSPDALEIAIDKYRTLARVASLGFPVPETEVVQSRREGLAAFDALGGDVVVKPLFGGEGRGVMRVRDRDLAWTVFSALERIDSVIYVQAFVKPGGIDNRLLVIGDKIFGIRRLAGNGWKTNVSQGGSSEAFIPEAWQTELARAVAADLNLKIGAVDLLERENGASVVVEVNAVPGWKGAESALDLDLAGEMLDCLEKQ